MIRIYRGPMSRAKIEEAKADLRAYLKATPGTIGAVFYDSHGITSIAGEDRGPKETLRAFSAELCAKRAPGMCEAAAMALGLN